jgi:glucokinase
LPPEAITERGLSGSCALCASVLEDFCALLGTAAGNLVLTLGARGGAYIGGGIVPQLQPMLAGSRFRQHFENHGRMSHYLAGLPCYIVTARNPALEGALACLDYL